MSPLGTFERFRGGLRKGKAQIERVEGVYEDATGIPWRFWWLVALQNVEMKRRSIMGWGLSSGLLLRCFGDECPGVIILPAPVEWSLVVSVIAFYGLLLYGVLWLLVRLGLIEK